MKNNTKTAIRLFLFHFVFWLGLRFTTREKGNWEWTHEIIFSLGYSTIVTYIYHLQMKSKQLYLAAGQGEEVILFLKSQGYLEKKKNDDTTFLRKEGWSFNPFAQTAVKQSAYYTLINATDSIIEKVPKHLERIRQPYTGK